MRFIDFLMYYFAEYFDRNKRLLTWNTPVEKSAYAIGLISIFWLFTLSGIFQLVGHADFTIPKYIPVIIAVALMYLLEFVYSKKGRYDYIVNTKLFKMSYRKGVTISILFFFLSPIPPIILAIIVGIIERS